MKIKEFLNLVNRFNSNAKFLLIDVDTDEQRPIGWSDFVGNAYKEKDYTIKGIEVEDNVVYIYYKKR